jgi:short subunit dehydrogenase-like uncharacterized protein
VAGELGLPHRVVSIDDETRLHEALDGVAAVLNCAGPFRDTFQSLVDACLVTGTHYLDITGEVDVIEALAAQAPDAVSKQVVLMPAVGFDVVPSDCLAVHVAKRLPTATRLTIAFDANTPPSHGTAITALRTGLQGTVRKQGRLQRVPAVSKRKTIDFGFDRGVATAFLIRWGDLATAYRSTGIGDIETYSVLSPDLVRTLKLAPYLASLLKVPVFERIGTRTMTRGRRGPSMAERNRRSSWLYAEVEDDGGARAAARLRAPHPYTLTAEAAVEATVRVLAGAVEPGFQTVGTSFGPDFILAFAGVEREDV